ncbi:MAG: diguanylate cyclase, partial [Clostridia bacterium]|nr:diguanylate cyclase [Clostridia bacterium]
FIVCISIYISISNQNKNHRIYKVAYIDPVTLLGNETYFKGNGSIYLEGKTAKNKYIITIDINKFKALNKVYGYAFCNEILKKLGQTIRDVLPSDNITCRIANDVFASIFSYEEDINELLDRIFNEASMLEVNGSIIDVNLAIGAYNILPDETDVNKILDKAYLARSQIKGLYHNNYYLFDEALENKLVEDQRLESGMEKGIKENEFIVVYQPKVFTSDEKVSGAEALVRWNRKGELIPPRKVYSVI